MKKIIASLALCCAAIVPAHAEPLPRAEWAFQALNIADLATTVDCLNRNVCEEANPLFGRHPSTGELIAGKAGIGILHLLTTRYLQAHAPRLVKPWEVVTVIVQGGVVAANLRFVF